MTNQFNQNQANEKTRKTSHYGFKAIVLTVGCLGLLGTSLGANVIHAAPYITSYVHGTATMAHINPQQFAPMTATTATVNPSKVANKKIEAVAGKTFDIKLEQNASTGYSWTYKADSQLKLVKASEQATPSKSKDGDPIVGAPTNKTWTFKATKPGTYKVSFKYEREWEKGAKPVQTIIYTVHIK